ncbi:Disintegrin and metalloproteinase domain-containing protein 18 [Chionoecetes opilio]|uniref:Disintegrin and metalloproteinase domain-containing protein 18 n=1 Tax=Chionoecetes opilio TaxID=41210 RepID=A0A8J4YJD9_CHIOP|nr:Disintegrin and metalloproteinase domain-containing protein 18 [Chionoecetes opilio]
MCIKQRCEEVPRPAGDCSGGCSGNGVCNSLDHCHCYAGYAPPNCSLAGPGGSVDSNVMSDVSDPWLPLTVAWVVVVLLLSLLGVTCCCWGCVKGWYKRKGRDNLSGSIPWCAACLDACCCPVMTKTARWMLTVGSSPEKKLMNRNIEVNEGENEDMLCSVDLEIKSTAETSSWGVASEKLVTELVTITPKDSPDTHRKVRLPSESPLQHHKSEDNLRRPNYLQSISMDSGCVSDSEDDDASNKRDSLKLSMSSLLSVLMKVGDKKPKTMKDSEHQLSRGTGSQKSIPLSRFVVDPLAGRRGARHGTPPPHHARPAYNRSISTDIISTRQNRKEGTPPPPPPSALKPNKSEENLSKAFESPSRGRFPPHRQHSPPTDTSTRASASPEKFIHENGARDPPTPTSGKAPLMPSKNKLLPPPPEKFIHKNSTRDPPTSTSGKAPLMPTKNKPLPSLPLKRNTPSPPQTGSQRHHGRSLNKRPIPPSGASRPSPPKTSSGVKGSLQDTAASKKVLEMTRKLKLHEVEVLRTKQWSASFCHVGTVGVLLTHTLFCRGAKALMGIVLLVGSLTTAPDTAG